MSLKALDRLRPYRVLDRPIFLIAPPRSGSTFLFELIRRFQNVWAWKFEMDEVWWNYFPLERQTVPSDHLSAEECTPRVVRALRRDFYRYSLWEREARGEPCGLKEKLGLRRIRYLDKTIANCFHLGFLKKAFPDAFFLFLVRDGRANVSSMLEGWNLRDRFERVPLRKYIPAGVAVQHWCYPAPPGWEKMLDRPLEEVCAWSWREHIETAARDLESVPAERQLRLKYEDLVAAPQEIAQQVSTCCQLNWQEETAEFISNKPLSRTTVTPPDQDKWRQLNGERIERILPLIEPTMKSLGYDLAAKSG